MERKGPTDGSGDPAELARTICLRGELLVQLGRQAAAIKQFDEAIRIDPSYADALVHRALAWHDLGEWQNAVRDCTAAIALCPTRAWAFNARALAWFSLWDLPA